MVELTSALEEEGTNVFHVPFLMYCFPSPTKKFPSSYERPYFVSYVSRNCRDNRDKLFTLLLEKSSNLKAHATGYCKNNMEKIEKESPKVHNQIVQSLESRENYCKNENFYKNYRFVIVMESQNKEGYLTEKIAKAFEAGAVPIYWGSGDYVKKIYNVKAMIRVEDFQTLEECADYIMKVENDRSLYNRIINEPIFANTVIPDIYKGENSELFRTIANLVKKGVPIN